MIETEEHGGNSDDIAVAVAVAVPLEELSCIRRCDVVADAHDNINRQYHIRIRRHIVAFLFTVPSI